MLESSSAPNDSDPSHVSFIYSLRTIPFSLSSIVVATLGTASAHLLKRKCLAGYFLVETELDTQREGDCEKDKPRTITSTNKFYL